MARFSNPGTLLHRLLRRSPWTFVLVCVPVLASLLALVLFEAQGGFGAGHGKYDGFIGSLQCPAILIVDKIQAPSFIPESDYFWILLLPFVGNLAIFASIGVSVDAVRAWRRRCAMSRGFKVFGQE